MDENEKQKRAEKIAYQNKDIVSKVMAEQFRGKSFAVYGIDIPRIAEVKPTNLPAIEANELRLDNLFLLDDGSYAFVDYESGYQEKNKCDYLKYLARVIERLYNETGGFVPVKVIILYTADVKKGSTHPVLDLDGIRLQLTEAFLIELDSDNIWNTVSTRIYRKEKLWDEDIMNLVIYPLTFPGTVAKQKAVSRTIRLAKKIADSEQMVFTLKLIWTFSDKFITEDDANKIREVLIMTKVDRIFAEEKREAVEKAVNEATVIVTQQVTEKIAKSLLLKGNSIEYVASVTEYPIEKIKKIWMSVKNTLE